jgi:hypothetical protein
MSHRCELGMMGMQSILFKTVEVASYVYYYIKHFLLYL